MLYNKIFIQNNSQPFAGAEGTTVFELTGVLFGAGAFGTPRLTFCVDGITFCLTTTDASDPPTTGTANKTKISNHPRS